MLLVLWREVDADQVVLCALMCVVLQNLGILLGRAQVVDRCCHLRIKRDRIPARRSMTMRIMRMRAEVGDPKMRVECCKARQ